MTLEEFLAAPARTVSPYTVTRAATLVISLLAHGQVVSEKEIARDLETPIERMRITLRGLYRRGFLTVRGDAQLLHRFDRLERGIPVEVCLSTKGHNLVRRIEARLGN